MNDLTLLVMAAGMGSRYGGLKQLDEVGSNGETIIDYSVYDAIEAGFNKVLFIIGKREIIKLIITTDFISNPNQRTINGATATAGSVCNKIA